MVTCQDIEGQPDSIRDVGWYLDPKYQGKGYGYEAAKRMVDYMFKEVGIDEIRTGAAIVNPSSWRIMEKLGFKRLDETKMVNYTYIDGETEIYLYNLNKGDYR